MKFDVIISNPPYQLADGGSGASATAIYNKFVNQAEKLNPRYLTMIIPSRWMAGGKGLDQFRKDMIQNKKLSIIHDYPNSSDCFTGVDIAGGVCYFLMDSKHNGKCRVFTHMDNTVFEKDRNLDDYDVFVRWSQAEDLLKKIISKNEETLDRYISISKPFGIRTFFSDYVEKPSRNTYKLYLSSQTGDRKVKYVNKDHIIKGQEYIDKWKVLMPTAYRVGSVTDGGTVHPIVAEPNSVCTETFNIIMTFNTEEEAKNLVSYIKTKFFRFLVFLRKPTQHAVAKVYKFVPVQDFTKPWTDEELYKKYKLSHDEIAFIEGMINPVEDGE